MTPDRPVRPPVLTAPPPALVVDGRHQLGSFDGPVPKVNPLAIVDATGWRRRVARTARNLRLKEWEAFQIGNDEWFVLGAVYDAKVLGIVMVIAVHRTSGRIERWIEKVPSSRVGVARGLEGTASIGLTRRGTLSITNVVGSGQVSVDGHHRGDQDRPALWLTGTGRTDADVRHIAVCHPFGGDRVLYTHKCLMPFDGEMRIGEETIGFAAGSSFMILDDHHGEYPSPQVYDWVTGAAHRPDGLIGFNLTRNQVQDPDTFNENVLWIGGELHRLPAVTFDRPDGIEGPWRVTDRSGTVDVTFTPEVDSTLHVGPGRTLAEYHAPYGSFTGHITVDGAATSVDGLFGMGERKNIRV